MMKKKRTRVGRAKERAADNFRDTLLLPFVRRKFREAVDDVSGDEVPPDINDDEYQRF
jgi:hypothetical protein